MKSRSFISILALMLAAFTAAAEVTGTWHGALKVGMQSLPIVVHFEGSGDALTATMDSPLQGAKGIPAEAKMHGDSVTVTVPAIWATYSAVVTGKEIRGTFTQSGMQFPLTLEPGDYVPPRPQTPQPPYPYETREVSFTNPADGAVLSGTLTLPTKYVLGRTVPTVVMVTGSGLQNRDEEIAGHKPFAVLAHHLATAGIASLRYDDRGFGKSTGDAHNATTDTFAADAAAAMAFLRSLPRISKAGVLGHSEGGTIAMMLGADGKADFVVSLAGAAVRGDSILMKQNERILGTVLPPETTADYIAALGVLYNYMRKHPGVTEWAGLDKATAKYSALTPELRDNMKAILAKRTPWIDRFIAYDPAEAIKRIRVPLLAVNGTLDTQVDCDMNLNAIRRHIPFTTPLTLLPETGLNHMMQHARTGLPQEYAEIEETMSPNLLKCISAWIISATKE